MFLICGLGNPGVKYADTRHNVGFRLVDVIVDYFEFTKIKDDNEKQLYSGVISNNKVLVLKPLTFMNSSGKIVSQIIKFYKINKDNVFVVHDDLDLKLAKIKIKNGGGNGGHNGLLSVDEYIGENYFRLRIGIDHPGHKDLVSNYVLSKFSEKEKKIIDKKLDKIKNNLDLFLKNIPLFLTRISED